MTTADGSGTAVTLSTPNVPTTVVPLRFPVEVAWRIRRANPLERNVAYPPGDPTAVRADSATEKSADCQPEPTPSEKGVVEM